MHEMMDRLSLFVDSLIDFPDDVTLFRALGDRTIEFTVGDVRALYTAVAITNPSATEVEGQLELDFGS